MTIYDMEEVSAPPEIARLRGELEGLNKGSLRRLHAAATLVHTGTEYRIRWEFRRKTTRMAKDYHLVVMSIGEILRNIPTIHGVERLTSILDEAHEIRFRIREGVPA